MTELELRVDGPEGAIPARAFVKIVDQGLALLRDLDLAASQRGVPPARWLITDLRKGSLVLVVRPEEQAERSDAELWRPARDLVHGVMTLEDEAVIPESFTSATLGRLVRLGRQVTRDNVEGISFESRNDDVALPASLTPAVVVHAERATSVHDSSLGSAEGFLDVISIREKKRHVSLYNPQTRRAVYCTYPKEFLPRLRDALGEEIRAWGLLRRNAVGQPVRLEIDDFEVLQPRRAVPISELTGVAPWWTGGEDAVDYIRRVRGA